MTFIVLLFIYDIRLLARIVILFTQFCIYVAVEVVQIYSAMF